MEFQPTVNPTDTYIPAEATPEKKPLKGNLIKLIGDSRTKIRAIVALALVAACLVIALASWLTAKNQSFLDMPISEKVFADQPGIRAEGTQVFAEAASAYQNALNQYSADLQRELTPDEYQAVVAYADVLRDCAGSLSLTNAQRLSDGYKELQNILLMKGGSLPEEYQAALDDNNASLADLDEALGIINSALLYGMLACVVLCLLGGIFRVKGLITLSLLVSIIYNALFVGTVFLVLSVVLHVALTVVLTQLKKQCKESLA